MEIIDITVGIKNGMLVWPGDAPVEIGWESRLEDGAESNISSIQIGAHVGTHIDMPLHFIEGAANLDSLDLALLIGPATVVDVLEDISEISAEFLEKLELKTVSRILFKTSNSRLWAGNSSSFFQNYVALGKDGAKWLVDHGCRLVGIDYLSIAPYEDPVGTHKILLSNGAVILETLDLRQVEAGEYQLICLPLKLESREAAPARAILMPTITPQCA